MNRALSRNFPLYISPKANQLVATISAWSSPGQPRRWYSPNFQSNEPQMDKPSSSSDNTNPSDDEDHRPIGNRELKRQIEKYYDGDEDALPCIFEAILRRKLAGVKDEEDAKLMKELDVDHPLDRTEGNEESDLESDEEDDDDDDDYEEEGNLNNAQGYRQ